MICEVRIWCCTVYIFNVWTNVSLNLKKMSSNVDLMVGNRPLSSLRVVDLKQELEKRGLSKSGSKKDLAERLKLVSYQL